MSSLFDEGVEIWIKGSMVNLLLPEELEWIGVVIHRTGAEAHLIDGEGYAQTSPSSSRAVEM